MTNLRTPVWCRGLIALMVMALLAPLSIPVAYAGEPRQIGAGMSTKKKVVLLAGAALLYYLWKKHQANQARKAGMSPNGGMAANARQPQLYRSKNGGVYYRDAQGKPVWLTVPQQGVQIPADEVVRYAPDYARYRGPAPAAPRGYHTQPFSQYDPALAGSNGM